MHNRTRLAAIATAALAAFALPSVTRAQDPMPPVPQPQPPTTQTSKGEVATPSFSSLLAAIDSASANAAKLQAAPVQSASDVQLVNVEGLVQGDNADSLKATIEKGDASATASLRSALGSDSTIAKVLSDNTPSLTPADIVAADVTSEGMVRLYYWKKP